jgi:hypothetical protein
VIALEGNGRRHTERKFTLLQLDGIQVKWEIVVVCDIKPSSHVLVGSNRFIVLQSLRIGFPFLEKF